MFTCSLDQSPPDPVGSAAGRANILPLYIGIFCGNGRFFPGEKRKNRKSKSKLAFSEQEPKEMTSQKIGDPEVPFILQTVKDQLSSSSLLQASLIASGLSVWPPPSPPGSQTRMCRSRSPLKQEEVGRWRSILFQPEQLQPPRVVSQGCDGAKVTFQW